MESGSSAPSSFFNKTCQTDSPSSSIIKYPTFSSLTKNNFKNAVDFNSEAKWPCRSSWYADVSSLHIRNRRLLDLPFSKPKCCSGIYNVLVDRKKLKKLQKYGLTKPVRKRTPNLEPEKIERCIPERDKQKSTPFPECYTLFECSSEDENDSDDDDDDGDDDDDDGDGDGDDGKNKEKSERDSSAKESKGVCSCGMDKNKMLKEIKKDWRGLLHVKETQLCKEAMAREFNKHKLGRDMKLNLKRVV